MFLVHSQLGEALVYRVCTTHDTSPQICTTDLWAPEPERKSPAADGPRKLVYETGDEIVMARGSAWDSFLPQDKSREN